jgi:inhibitor of Bruton tyrosine kinase
MSHLLWKYYWENDVERFRRLLSPAGYNVQAPSKSPGIGAGSFGASPGGHGTSPRTTKSRRVSGHAPGLGNLKGINGGLGKAEVNSRDYIGLTVLLRAAASTSENAILFLQALLEHPAVDLYAQDPESGWNALHRALYSGNISIARLLLEKERRDLTETFGTSISRVGQLIKTKDHEGNSPFDLYNSTIATRDLKADDDASEDSDGGSDSESSSAGSSDG